MRAAMKLFAKLDDEQRVLVAGAGADTRDAREWTRMLEGVAAFDEAAAPARGRMLALAVASAFAAVGSVALVMFLEQRGDDGLRYFSLPIAATGLALVSASGWAWLKARYVSPHLRRVTLPLIRQLKDRFGEGADCYLSLSLERRPSDAGQHAWLDGAMLMSKGRILHFKVRDLIEGGNPRCVASATVSDHGDGVETHSVGEDDPTASGMTREVAAEAEAGGNPFSSMEMLALKTAHGVQLELSRLEAFGAREVPPPPMGRVVSEGRQERGRGFEELGLEEMERLIGDVLKQAEG
jgi:hypothetical protein